MDSNSKLLNKVGERRRGWGGERLERILLESENKRNTTKNSRFIPYLPEDIWVASKFGQLGIKLL